MDNETAGDVVCPYCGKPVPAEHEHFMKVSCGFAVACCSECGRNYLLGKRVYYSTYKMESDYGKSSVCP